MKKFCRNVCLIVSSTIGVGFLSGKELQIFVGNPKNIPIFVVIFALGTALYSVWAQKYRCQNIQELCRKTFGKYADIVYLSLMFGNVATTVALLATADETCCEIVGIFFPFPVFALTICVAASIIQRQTKTANMLSVIALILVVAYISVPIFCRETKEQFFPTNVSVFQTVVYALFSSTALLGITVRISAKETTQRNILVSVVSAVTLAVIMYVKMTYAPLSESSDAFRKMFSAITLFASATTSVYANCLLPLSVLDSMTHDRTFSAYALFAFCLLLCLLKADFLIEVGYTLVAIFGTVLVLVNLVKFACKIHIKCKIKEYYV